MPSSLAATAFQAPPPLPPRGAGCVTASCHDAQRQRPGLTLRSRLRLRLRHRRREENTTSLRSATSAAREPAPISMTLKPRLRLRAHPKVPPPVGCAAFVRRMEMRRLRYGTCVTYDGHPSADVRRNCIFVWSLESVGLRGRNGSSWSVVGGSHDGQVDMKMNRQLAYVDSRVSTPGVQEHFTRVS